MASPSDVAGLQLRLRASALGALADNTTVTTPIDESANAYTLAAGGGVKYRTNAVNGKPVFELNAATDPAPGGTNGAAAMIRAVSTATLQSVLASGFTYVALIKVNDAGFGTIAGKNGATSCRTWLNYGKYNNANGRLSVYQGAGESPVVADSSYHAVAVSVDAASAAKFYVDSLAATSGPAGSGGPDASRLFTIGQLDDNTWLGSFELAEFMVYDHVLSQTEINTLGAYTLSEYGIALGTPASAPTAVTVAGSNAGNQGTPSTYTVAANGTVTSDVVVAISATGVSGTLSASSVTLTSASPTKTFTFTPSAQGTAVLSAASSGLTTGTLSVVEGPPALALVYTGDSNVSRNFSPPITSAILQALGAASRPVVSANTGVSGSPTYYHTKGAPQLNGVQLYDATVAAANGIGAEGIAIRIGTNDAKALALTSKASYKSAIQSIVTSYFLDVPTLKWVALLPPVTPTTGYSQGGEWNGTTSVAAVQSFQDACAEIAAVDPRVTCAGVGAASRFQAAPGLTVDGIHWPDGVAAQAVAGNDALAIARAAGLIPKVSGIRALLQI